MSKEAEGVWGNITNARVHHALYEEFRFSEVRLQETIAKF